MKKGWPTKRLGEVCEIIMGQSPDGESYNTTGEGVPLINGPVEFSAESFGKTVRTKFTTQPTKFCKEGDLILCVRGSTTGRMNIAGFDACVGRGVAAIRAKQYQPWINHFVSSKRDEIHGKGTGATFPNVSGDSLANFELVVPPLAEQQRIVGLLDEAFEGLATAKANAEKNLQNARALFASHLQSVFTQRGPGWQTKKLGDVSDVMNGGTPKTGVPEYWAGQHRWITPAEMGKRVSPYVSDTERKITDLGLRDSSARMLPPNSVILSSRAPIGHLVINTEPMGTNQGCKGLIPHSQIETKFLYYYLSSIVDLLNSLGTGATFKELSGGKLKEVTVPVPPLAEQQKIGAKLDRLAEETQRLARLYERKQAALEALKKSLLHQAFNGEL